MYICLMYSKELLKGTLKTIILKLLSSNDRMYGYEITQKVKILTHEKIQLTEGALYPTLHKLEADGMVTTEIENINGRKRKYYKSLLLAAWKQLNDQMNLLSLSKPCYCY